MPMPEAAHAAGHHAELGAAGARQADAAVVQGAATFRWPVRVYYEDTDAGGVVYFANYLKFMERARTEWLRAHGFELTDLEARHGIVFVVRAVEIDYLRPGRLNDALQVTLKLAGSGRAHIVVVQQVLRGGDVLAEARVRIVCVGTKTMKPARIPQAVLERLASKHTERKT